MFTMLLISYAIQTVGRVHYSEPSSLWCALCDVHDMTKSLIIIIILFILISRPQNQPNSCWNTFFWGCYHSFPINITLFLVKCHSTQSISFHLTLFRIQKDRKPCQASPQATISKNIWDCSQVYVCALAGLRLDYPSPTPSPPPHPLDNQEQTIVPGPPLGYSAEKVTT